MTEADEKAFVDKNMYYVFMRKVNLFKDSLKSDMLLLCFNMGVCSYVISQHHNLFVYGDSIVLHLICMIFVHLKLSWLF